MIIVLWARAIEVIIDIRTFPTHVFVDLLFERFVLYVLAWNSPSFISTRYMKRLPNI